MVTAAGEASQALEALGTPADRVPRAHVRIRRVGESPVEAGTTDSLGHVTFTQLLPGRYDVTSLRLLSEDETARITEADSTLTGINAFGGGGRVQVQPPSSTRDVEAVAGRRGSLVISEVHDWSPREIGGPTVQYSLAKYVEVYNNADTTVFLDGKIIAQAFDFVWESDASPDRCRDHERWRLDPEGIWAQRVLRFPGSGRQYTLSWRVRLAWWRSRRSITMNSIPDPDFRTSREPISRSWARVRTSTIRLCPTWSTSGSGLPSTRWDGGCC